MLMTLRNLLCCVDCDDLESVVVGALGMVEKQLLRPGALAMFDLCERNQ